jgi:ribosomal protein S18 acetylase RimI-like enzyme
VTLTFEQAQTPEDVAAVRALFVEYADGLKVDLCFQGFAAELRDLPGDYAAPRGRLILARRDGEPVGCVGLRPIDASVAELKRLYVRPAARGLGLGKRLTELAIDAARAIGYHAVVLDTLATMTEAHRLYAALGFHETAPYYVNPLPGVRYLRLALQAETVRS